MNKESIFESFKQSDIFKNHHSISDKNSIDIFEVLHDSNKGVLVAIAMDDLYAVKINDVWIEARVDFKVNGKDGYQNILLNSGYSKQFSTTVILGDDAVACGIYIKK